MAELIALAPYHGDRLVQVGFLRRPSQVNLVTAYPPKGGYPPGHEPDEEQAQAWVNWVIARTASQLNDARIGRPTQVAPGVCLCCAEVVQPGTTHWWDVTACAVVPDNKARCACGSFVYFNEERLSTFCVASDALIEAPLGTRFQCPLAPMPTKEV